MPKAEADDPRVLRFLEEVSAIAMAPCTSLAATIDDAGIDSLAAVEIIQLLEDLGAEVSEEMIHGWSTLRDISTIYMQFEEI